MAKATKRIHCPECGGTAIFETRADTVEYKGHTAAVKVPGHWCEKCGEAVLEGDALEKRERAFLELRARVEGVLSPRQVSVIRERLKLSQRRAGELLGGGPRAFQKYESGEQQVSVPMANLLRLLDKDPRRLADLVQVSAQRVAVRSRTSARMVQERIQAPRAAIRRWGRPRKSPAS